jgi:hypothetical protein
MQLLKSLLDKGCHAAQKNDAQHVAIAQSLAQIYER